MSYNQLMRASLLLSLLLVSGSCSRTSSEQEPAPARKTAKDPAAAKRLIAEGATVIDVRTTSEFARGHLPTATNIPVDEVAGRLPEIDKLVGGDKTKPVVVYCAAGSRSAKAQRTLEEAGYQHVVNGGGLDDLE